jgi:hypothetical protein
VAKPQEAQEATSQHPRLFVLLQRKLCFWMVQWWSLLPLANVASTWSLCIEGQRWRFLQRQQLLCITWLSMWTLWDAQSEPKVQTRQRMFNRLV